MEEWMSRSSGIPLEELRPHMFLFRDKDATSHLLRCALTRAAGGRRPVPYMCCVKSRWSAAASHALCLLRALALALVGTCVSTVRRPVCS